MMNIVTIRKGISALLSTVLGVFAITPSSSVAASELTDDSCEAIEAIGGECGSSEGAVGDLMETITSTLLFLVGGISVIMIIIGGIRFVLSRGDQQAAASARNTVLYAVVGLVVAVLAWAIINWVLGVLEGEPPGGSSAPSGASASPHSPIAD